MAEAKGRKHLHPHPHPLSLLSLSLSLSLTLPLSACLRPSLHFEYEPAISTIRQKAGLCMEQLSFVWVRHGDEEKFAAKPSKLAYKNRKTKYFNNIWYNNCFQQITQDAECAWLNPSLERIVLIANSEHLNLNSKLSFQNRLRMLICFCAGIKNSGASLHRLKSTWRRIKLRRMPSSKKSINTLSLGELKKPRIQQWKMWKHPHNQSLTICRPFNNNSILAKNYWPLRWSNSFALSVVNSTNKAAANIRPTKLPSFGVFDRLLRGYRQL